MSYNDPIKQREQTRKYYLKNKEKIKEYQKKWRQNNKDYSKRYHKEWRKHNKDRIKKYAQTIKQKVYRSQYNKEYKKSSAGKDSARRYTIKYRQTDKNKKYNKEYRRIHKQYFKEYNKTFARSERGREIDRKAKAKRKQFGFISLNEWFEGCEGHHIDFERVIYIPKAIHRSVYHSVSLSKGMDEINKLAFDYMEMKNITNRFISIIRQISLRETKQKLRRKY